MMPFSKNDPNTKKGGRPKGSKDKSWATLEYWFLELKRDLSDSRLPIGDKVRAEMKLIELIISKRNLPNETSTDSVSNAKAIMDELKSIEAKAKSEQTNTGKTDTLRLDGGKAPL